MTSVRTRNMLHARVARASTEIHLPTHLRWMEKAKCLRKGIDNFWLAQKRPTQDDYDEVIKTWCLPCPVRPECLVNAIQKETLAKHTSRGVEGGATPRERATLRRRIREAKVCVTLGVLRWLDKKPISRDRAPDKPKFTVTLTNSDGRLVYRQTANTSHGAHIIAVRELRLHSVSTVIVATVKNPDNRIIEVLSSHTYPYRVRSRSVPRASAP